VIYGADGRRLGQAMAEAQRPLLDWVKQLSAENADLVRRLEQAREGAQAPGSQQAVAEAVDATAKDAAAGNPRAKQALELLNAGKIAEAVPLFQAEAAEKEATSRRDAKEAAAAYRNLGAIASLADPKRALEAYEKAVALDPDDLESLFWAGYIQIDYGDLNKAQTRLERVLTLARTDDQAGHKYWALVGLGDIKRRRGDLEAALKSYNDGLAIIERLAKSDSGNAQWQFDLGISNERIGNVRMEQGDLTAALKSYETKRDIISRLAKADPGHTGWQRDLSVSYNKIGDVQVAQGDLAGALKSFQADLAIAEKLAKADPGNAGWQRDLVVSFGKLGLAHKQSGDSAKALDSLRQGQAIMARMTKLSPDNAEWKQDLAKFDGLIAELAAR
jgi:tetratricopeptide (TPR) repeat protein